MSTKTKYIIGHTYTLVSFAMNDSHFKPELIGQQFIYIGIKHFLPAFIKKGSSSQIEMSETDEYLFMNETVLLPSTDLLPSKL